MDSSPDYVKLRMTEKINDVVSINGAAPSFKTASSITPCLKRRRILHFVQDDRIALEFISVRQLPD